MTASLSSMNNLESLVSSDSGKVFELLHTGIAVMSNEGRFLYCNRAFLEMFNLPDDVVGKHVTEYFITGEAGVMTTIRTLKPTFCTSLTTGNEQGISFRYPLLDREGKLQGVIIETIPPSIGKERLAKLMSIIHDLEKKSHYLEQKAIKKSGAWHTFDTILGESQAILDLKSMGARFARSSEPILVLGESGTGKELVAQALHSASPRAKKPFVTVNCAALPQELMEAELFGYESGAFTGAKSGGIKGKFELANQGTIFLDEIGELPLAMQAKLLRVLESGEIQKLAHKGSLHSDFRLIAATNRNLADCVREGTFRQDLYHRLNILEISIPPLRERLEDIPMLCAHFIEQHVGPQSAANFQISPELYRTLRQSAWPGNIRELKNILTFAIFNLEEGEHILTPAHLPERFLAAIRQDAAVEAAAPVASRRRDRAPADIARSAGGFPPSRAPAGDTPEKEVQSISAARNDTEIRVLQEAMKKAKYNKCVAAGILGISRSHLYRKLKQLGLMGEKGRYCEENWE